MVTKIQIAYIEARIICPHCGYEGNFQTPENGDAVPAGFEFMCAACGTVYEIYLKRPTRDAQLRIGADDAGQTCPYCNDTKVLLNGDEERTCWHCYDFSGQI